MLKNFLLLTFTIFLLSACSAEEEIESQAKQIEEYCKELEDCKDNVAEKKSDQESEEEAEQEIKKQVFGRSYTAEPDDIALGNNRSKLILVEYFSPTCPHCVKAPSS